MHETAYQPAAASEPTSSEGGLPAVSAPAPPGQEPPAPSWAGRLLQSGLALPRYLFRHPGRGLAIAFLLVFIGGGVALAGAYLWSAYHLRAARAAMERYHTTDAIAHLQSCLMVRPHDPEALLLAARAARRTGGFDDADRYLDQYQEVRGKDDEDLVLERVLVRAERGELDSVSSYCFSLIDQNHPASVLVLEALTRGYMRMYRLHESERALNEWLERQPEDPEAFILQGQLHELRIRSQDAIASYRRALTIDPELDEARLRLVSALMQLGLAEETLPHLEYLSRRFPNNLMVRVNLARARDRMGHTEEAEQILQEVLARQPNYPPALAERGKLAVRDGRTVEAEKWLRQAVALEPSDYQARYQLSLCLEKNGKPEEARQEEVRRQQVEEDMKRIQEISTILMQQAPHNAQLHYEAGTIALRAGSIEEGLRWLRSALKEDPHHQPTHKALMEHYQRMGDFRRAAQHRREAGLPEADTPATPAGGAKKP